MSRVSPQRGLLAVTILLAVSQAVGCAAAPGGTTEPGSASTTPATSGAPASAPASRTPYPLELQDGEGRRVTIPAPPQRIVSLSPAHTEILFALGAGDRMVGRDDFSDYPPKANDLPKVGYSNIDLEKLAALNPDFVYAATRQKKFLPNFEQLGLRVYYAVEPITAQGVFEHILALGRVTDRQQEAEELVARMRTQMDGITQKLAEAQRGPMVYYELTPELFTASPSSFIGDMLRLLKARNAAEGIEAPFPQLSLETLVTKDPEVIILADAPPYGKESPETVKARPGWREIAAVKSARIYAIDPDLVTRPGPRVVEGMAQLAKMLYPERY